MAKFEYTPDDSQQTKEPQRTRQGHGSCEVYGCPRAGHIYTAGWNCRYHHGKSGQSLARTTLALKNHASEINWYEVVLNATVTDFGMGDIAKDAPGSLHVLPNETLKEYRARMERHINNLFEPKNDRLQQEVAL